MRQPAVDLAYGCIVLLVVVRVVLLGYATEAVQMLRQQPPKQPGPGSRWNQLIETYRDRLRSQALFFAAAVVGVFSAYFGRHPLHAIVELLGLFLIVLTCYLSCASLSLGVTAYRLLRAATPPTSRGDAYLRAGSLLCVGWAITLASAVLCDLCPD